MKARTFLALGSVLVAAGFAVVSGGKPQGSTSLYVLELDGISVGSSRSIAFGNISSGTVGGQYGAVLRIAAVPPWRSTDIEEPCLAGAINLRLRGRLVPA